MEHTTHDQMAEDIARATAKKQRNVIKDERCHNHLLVADGTIFIVAADNKRADVFINSSTVATPGVPNVYGLSLAPGDQVKVLMADPRDPAILYKKVL